MFSYKMEGLPGLLLRLMLTGLLVSANTFSPSTHGIPFFEKPSKPGKLEEEMKVQGESLSIKGFCSQQKKVWCKGDLLRECNPTESPSLSGPGWKYLTTETNQRVVLQDLKNGCFSFLMSALQVEDSGIYLFGITDGLNIVPLRKIKVIVRKGQQNYGTVTETSENEQRLYHIVLVLVSIAVGITIIAALILVVTMLIKKKTREADDLNFGDNPNCRIITFQIHESTATGNPLDKETNAVYAILKKPKSMTEDVTYVNTKFPLRSSFNKNPSELSSPGECSPGVISSGSVKYANIIFGSQVPHIKD
ncbi:uncharacterized protein LOC114598461 isoform X3 [Podarcis muralis]